jgi:anhydro-N-acetylmuramic acid kinase
MSNQRLHRLLEKDSRLVVGMMSGTSVDGVDAVLARLTGTGPDMSIEVIASVGRSYSADLRELVLENSGIEASSVYNISQLNIRLAHEYARVVGELLEKAGVSNADVDAIGSHGQTVHHVPIAADCAGLPTTSTLQIGDPSTLAVLTGIPVVGDFRVADMALGGQGAPLVPYFDHVAFGDESESRGLLNLGGIANITVIPAGASPEDVVAFDTGPANMIIDSLCQRFFLESYDDGGERAASGHVDDDLLVWLLTNDPYLDFPPPKSTGREHYDDQFVDEVVRVGRSHDLSDQDILATATAFTAASVYQAYARYLRSSHPIDVLIAAGGGRYNRFLMQKLADSFSPIRVVPIDEFGIESDVKEALCFAVLAHEYLNGVPTALPSVTGASRAAMLGKLCLPA